MRSSIILALTFALFIGACTSAPDSDDPPVVEEEEPIVEEYTVLVKARLASDDPAVNQAAHDQVAGGAQEDAMAMGDLAHYVFLGMEDPQSFLAIDIWDNLENIPAFFENPDVQGAFSAIFEGPTEVAIYDRPEGYSSWGEFDVADDTIVVTVEGTLLLDTEEDNLVAHNQVADGGRETAQSLGDYAHVVYLDTADRRQFLAIDLWSDPEGMATFFGDADVQTAFASLFEAPPTVNVWLPSGYLQW